MHALLNFAAESAGEESEGIAALGLDPIAMLLQAGSFLLIYLIIKKYALDKIVKALDERRQKINESLKNVDEIEAQKEQVAKESEMALKKARSEADSIIAKSHEEAGAIVAEAEKKAQVQADKIVEKANKKTEADIAKAKQELKGEMLGLVTQATETVLKEKIDAEKDKQLISDAVKRGARG